ncbi:hypothetical protein [Pantoea dispersa]|uniref:hypothetical protein n=1 Tax=Pantoea dispersa TaxID=59814 RepID=UPI0039BDD72D
MSKDVALLLCCFVALLLCCFVALLLCCFVALLLCCFLSWYLSEARRGAGLMSFFSDIKNIPMTFLALHQTMFL